VNSTDTETGHRKCMDSRLPRC